MFRPQSTVVVSNLGGVEPGARLSDAVSKALMSRLGALKYSIDQAKVEVLQRADSNGGQLSRIYSSLGSFGVLAGILLLVNIFFMLADERKSELGMLRAVGLRRLALRRRVRGRGLVLRHHVGGCRHVRGPRARARDHGSCGAPARQ